MESTTSTLANSIKRGRRSIFAKDQPTILLNGQNIRDSLLQNVEKNRSSSPLITNSKIIRPSTLSHSRIIRETVGTPFRMQPNFINNQVRPVHFFNENMIMHRPTSSFVCSQPIQHVSRLVIPSNKQPITTQFVYHNVPPPKAIVFDQPSVLKVIENIDRRPRQEVLKLKKINSNLKADFREVCDELTIIKQDLQIKEYVHERLFYEKSVFEIENIFKQETMQALNRIGEINQAEKTQIMKIRKERY